MTEILNIILGALIAMLSSVITTVILGRIQRKNDEIKRMWEVSNLYYEEQKTILYDRLQIIEDWALKTAHVVNIMSEIEDAIKQGDEFQDMTNEIKPIYFVQHIVGIIKVYGDPQLEKLTLELLSSLGSISDRIKAISNNEIVADDPNPYSQYSVQYGNLIKKIDELKMNLFNTHQLHRK